MVKFTETQINMMKKHIEKGLTVVEVAYEMGPDVSYQVVQYYNKKFDKQ